MRFFNNPILMTYNVAVADASSGAVADRIKGPPGARGMILALDSHITTEVTTAADVFQIGISGDADEYGTFSVAAGAAGTVDAATRAELGAIALLSADTAIEFSNTGASDAGAYDVNVCVAWERKHPLP